MPDKEIYHCKDHCSQFLLEPIEEGGNFRIVSGNVVGSVFSPFALPSFSLALCTKKAGHDIKSLAINLATLIFFFLPVCLYVYPEYAKEQCIVTAIGFAVAFLAPPIGVLRPHPYSDLPGNKPFAPRMTFTEHAIKQK